ncbi:unnamed protein product [Gadus morhua 'NCC']
MRASYAPYTDIVPVVNVSVLDSCASTPAAAAAAATSPRPTPPPSWTTSTPPTAASPRPPPASAAPPRRRRRRRRQTTTQLGHRGLCGGGGVLGHGCSAPSTLSIKEESKGDLRLLYSLAPPEGRLAEGSREEGLKGEDNGGRGGGREHAHGLLWVPKERAGGERGAAGGGVSPSLFSSPLSYVAANHEASPQHKRGVASPSMVYLGEGKPFGGGRHGGAGGGGGGGGGEKQSPMTPQQYVVGGGGGGGGGGASSAGQEAKGSAGKEESQSLLRRFIGRDAGRLRTEPAHWSASAPVSDMFQPSRQRGGTRPLLVVRPSSANHVAHVPDPGPMAGWLLTDVM